MPSWKDCTCLGSGWGQGLGRLREDLMDWEPLRGSPQHGVHLSRASTVTSSAQAGREVRVRDYAAVSHCWCAVGHPQGVCGCGGLRRILQAGPERAAVVSLCLSRIVPAELQGRGRARPGEPREQADGEALQQGAFRERNGAVQEGSLLLVSGSHGPSW